MEQDARINKGELGSIAQFDREQEEAKQYWDDLSGKSLKPGLVREARKRKWRSFANMGYT